MGARGPKPRATKTRVAIIIAAVDDEWQGDLVSFNSFPHCQIKLFSLFPLISQSLAMKNHKTILLPGI
jgi:hypothetical protein